MSVISVGFILFIFATLVLYFIVPKKMQWVVLLISSMFFYLINGAENVIYILITALSAYGAALLMQNISDKQKLQA